MGEVMAAKDLEGIFEAGSALLPHRETQQFLHTIADEPENFLQRAFRQTQFGQSQIHRLCNIPLGLDQCAVKIEDEQLYGCLPHYLAFRKELSSAVRMPRWAVSCSCSAASRAKFTIRGTPI